MLSCRCLLNLSYHEDGGGTCPLNVEHQLDCMASHTEDRILFEGIRVSFNKSERETKLEVLICFLYFVLLPQ
jgi:hypothetical protein